MTGRAENKKYHYFYKITNNLNGKYYYGVHNTDNLEDGYMGSGKRLQLAFKKYGIGNFSKKILKFFDTSKEAFNFESEVVTEDLVKNDKCYNCELGGVFIDTTGFVPVKDQYGNKFLVDVNDERYKNGILVGVTKGTTIVEDKNGTRFRVSTEDSRFKSGALKNISKNKITVKDTANNFYFVDTSDERYLSGELKPVWHGRKHTEKSIAKMKDTYKKSGHQQGEKNSQYGTKWLNNGSINRKANAEDVDVLLKEGWTLGRLIPKDTMKKMQDSIKEHGGKNTVWISNDKLQKSTYVKKTKLENYLQNGWYKGRKYYENKT